MTKMHKFPVDLSAEDYTVLTKLRDHLGIPAAVIFRWALRHYAIYGPWTDGMDGERVSVLEGLGRIMVGPGVYERITCDEDKTTGSTPRPSPTRRRKSTA